MDTVEAIIFLRSRGFIITEGIIKSGKSNLTREEKAAINALKEEYTYVERLYQ